MPPPLGELVAVAALGAGAGLAVAVPLGPVGLLILDRGLRGGRGAGLAAAAGVATVDLGYAIVAVTTAGATRMFIDAVRGPAAALGALLLVGLAVRGFRDRDADHAEPAEVVAAARPWATFVAFVGLTLVNPATILTFAGLAVGLSDRLVDATTRAVFVSSVGLASLVWQVGLALAGAALGRAPRPRLRRATRLVGATVLLVFGLLLAVESVRELTG